MTEQSFITTELQKFNITDTVIAGYKEQFMSLVLDDLTDRETFNQIHEARMTIKNKRVEVQKTGKALREDANAFNKAVLAEEKRIISLLDPIETHLETEEVKVKAEEERLQKIKVEAEAKRNQERITTLVSYGCQFNGIGYQLSGINIEMQSVKVLDDEKWNGFIEQIKVESDRLAKVKADEEQRQKDEAENLRIQKAELDKQIAATKDTISKVTDEMKARNAATATTP